MQLLEGNVLTMLKPVVPKIVLSYWIVKFAYFRFKYKNINALSSGRGFFPFVFMPFDNEIQKYIYYF